ncbi:hypothetical protein C8R45DRAFT_1101610 [Mycena sanguinolenta]|nr:hypothetical protein C8R45DRAFT_1101610 [Mycena sanguinolenta]
MRIHSALSSAIRSYSSAACTTRSVIAKSTASLAAGLLDSHRLVLRSTLRRVGLGFGAVFGAAARSASTYRGGDSAGLPDTTDAGETAEETRDRAQWKSSGATTLVAEWRSDEGVLVPLFSYCVSRSTTHSRARGAILMIKLHSILRTRPVLDDNEAQIRLVLRHSRTDRIYGHVSRILSAPSYRRPQPRAGDDVLHLTRNDGRRVFSKGMHSEGTFRDKEESRVGAVTRACAPLLLPSATNLHSTRIVLPGLSPPS